MNLEKKHLECVGRPRHLLNHYDPAFFRYRPDLLSPEAFVEALLDFTRWDDFRFDAVLWDINGNKACYPSKFIPHVGENSTSLAGARARLRLLIADESAPGGGGAEHVESGLIRRHPYVLGEGLWSRPVQRSTAASLEVRINSGRLAFSGVEAGWLVYVVQPLQLASGTNLLELRLAAGSEGIRIEKIELDLDPRPPSP